MYADYLLESSTFFSLMDLFHPNVNILKKLSHFETKHYKPEKSSSLVPYFSLVYVFIYFYFYFFQ